MMPNRRSGGTHGITHTTIGKQHIQMKEILIHLVGEPQGVREKRGG